MSSPSTVPGRRLAQQPAALCLASLFLAPSLAVAGPRVSEVLAAEDACTPAAPRAASPACSVCALQGVAKARSAAGALGQASSPRSFANEASAPSSASPADQSTLSRTPTRGLKVLVAGLPKTGTSSMHVALKRLGYRSVHGEFLELSSYSKIWTDWEHGNPWPVIDKMLAMDFSAASDRPWCYLYEEFLHLNPELKVILTMYPHGPEGWAHSLEKWTRGLRDINPGLSPEVFWNSTRGQLASNHIMQNLTHCDVGYPPHSDWSATQKAACRDGYLEYNRRVKATIPPHQLLEYVVTEGWQPLCAFLNVKDCPQEPFPHTPDPILMTAGEVAHDAVESVKKAMGLPHERHNLPYDLFDPRNSPLLPTGLVNALR